MAMMGMVVMMVYVYLSEMLCQRVRIEDEEVLSLYENNKNS
jgi:hypothetical protein